MRRAVLTALSLMLWAFGASSASAACQPAQVAPQGQAVHTARAALMRIPLGEMDPSITPAAQRAIEATKDRIIAFITAAMSCAAPGASAQAIRQFLVAHGDALVERTVYTEHNMPPDRHGGGLTYEVTRPAGHPDMLAVLARLAIECGDDAVLLLFERTGNGWHPLLIRRSPPYRDVSGAFGGYRYAVSPPDAQGHWFLATVRRPPWCTSNWSSLYYEFSRPGRTPAAPDIFFRERVGVYGGYGEAVELHAQPGRFQLVHDGGFFDPGILIRRHVETYAVVGNRVSRVAPIAFNVRDFVDEWLDMRWAEASAWSRSGLAASHRQLNEQPEGVFREQGPVRRCGPDLYQVEIDPRRGDPNGRDPSPWYISVRGNGPYRLENVARSPSPRCGGPDLGPQIERINSADRERRGD